MSLKTSRANEPAEVRIDYETCNGCGLCVKVCKGAPLYLDNGRVQVDQARLFGCIGCGQCVTVCPRNSITVEGRDLFSTDIVDLPPQTAQAGYEQLSALLLTRRSVRDFLSREVEAEKIEKILNAAATAPMGIPPSDVGVLVLAGRDKVQEFRRDLTHSIQGMRWMFSPPALWLMRPFIGREAFESFKSFVGPVLDIYQQKDNEGVDWFLYDAPLALYFYGSAYSDPADPLIAATYAMLAGQALGLGSCMLGFPGYIIKYSQSIKSKYLLPPKMQSGLVVIFGYPAVRYHRAIKRRFAAVQYYQ